MSNDYTPPSAPPKPGCTSPLYLALMGLARMYRGEPCFCGMAIGNPMYREHSRACAAAKAAMKEEESRGE
jgi:hypothetical protein